MKILKLSKSGVLKIHLEDTDSYEVTDDNGVDVWFSPKDLRKIKEGVE